MALLADWGLLDGLSLASTALANVVTDDMLPPGMSLGHPRMGAPVWPMVYHSLDFVLWLIYWKIVVSMVFALLISWRLFSLQTPWVNQIDSLLDATSEPMLRPIRAILRPIGGVDWAEVILMMLVFYARDMLAAYWPYH